MSTLFLRVAVVTALLAATACSTLPGDREAADVRREAATLLGLPADTPSPAADVVTRRLAAPLSGDDAAVIALLNHPARVRHDADLRLAAAARLAATRPPNPAFSFGRFRRGDERETERGVHLDLLALAAWPVAAGSARREFAVARHTALRAALQQAQDARNAWVLAVAARSDATHARIVRDAAATGHTYAQRLADTGNASRLQEARAQAFLAEAEAAFLRATAADAAARERLARALGVDDPGSLQLPAELPPVPATVRSRPDSEQTALDNRLDVLAARRHAEATARALRLQRVTRFVNVLEVGWQHNSADNEPRQTGYEVTLELPLFDGGRARGAVAQARYEAAVARVAEIALDARSEARAAWHDYDSAWQAAAQYRDTVLPQQARITRELLLRWNGMLVGPFELLEQAREQARANAAAQAALRDFWLADARLDAVLYGLGDTLPAATAITPPAAAGGAGH